MEHSQTSHARTQGDEEVKLGYLNEAVEMEWKERGPLGPRGSGKFFSVSLCK